MCKPGFHVVRGHYRTCQSGTKTWVLWLILCCLLTSVAHAVNGEMPIDDTTLKLRDGRILQLQRRGDHAHALILRDGKRALWTMEFSEEYDRLWDYAFFVPMLPPNVYQRDVNHDQFPEVAIATWDGGNNMMHRTALIFSVLPSSMRYLCTRPFNLEYGRAVFENGPRGMAGCGRIAEHP